MSDLKDPRVLFAAERTLLAWNRTSLSLIAFGFVVERAGLLIRVIEPSLVQGSQANLIFGLGVAFIVLGSIASGYSSKQFLTVLRSLSPEEFPPGYSPRWGLLVNGSVALLGAALAGALVAWRLI